VTGDSGPGGVHMSGCVVVVSGPSGSGKTSVCEELAKDASVVRSVSVTTRAPRGGERDGREYVFVTEEEFRRGIAGGRFLEWAEVFGQLYGTPREPVDRALAEGKWIVLNIDTQGAQRLRDQGVAGVYVFLMPPSLEELERRLRGRNTESEDAIARRLARAAREMSEAPRYDVTVVNDRLERAVAEVRRVVRERVDALAGRSRAGR